MAVSFGAKRVSKRWRRVLTAAQADGVRFTLNSGRRTLAEQWALYRNPPRDANGRPVPVAFPNPNAPHIHVGRQAHALDISTVDGGEGRLQRWLEAMGVGVTNPVASEPWHQQVSDTDLKRLADHLRARERAAKAKAKRKAKQEQRAERKHKAREHANYVDVIFAEAERQDLPLALAFALIEQESGFRNVFGHDPSGNHVGAGDVTREKYEAYKRQRGPSGRGGMQGVGPAQLTWWQFQDRADQRGGCWLPEHNIAVGLEIVKGHIKAHGERRGLGVYNGGSANPNLTYADQVLARKRKWQERLK